MNTDLQLYSIFGAAFTPLVVLYFALDADRRRNKKNEKPPQDEKLLRPAGHSLAIRVEETQEKLLTDLLRAGALCGFAGVFLILMGQLVALHFSAKWVIPVFITTVLFAALGIAATLRTLKHFREGQNIRLGLRGEQAVAEVLHEVGDAGFRAFHDLPGGDDWNIDHVAVGSRGVYLIETKARRRRQSRNGKKAHVVLYDGKTLEFPFWKDTETIPQAQRNARWLSNYLEKKTGEPVEVQPLVVLPGWFVEQGKGNFAIKAMNANYLAKYLRVRPETIQPTQVRRLITALDEKCRDLEF